MSNSATKHQMPFLEIWYGEDNTTAHYWQTGRYFFRQYDFETKAKRISEKEYMSAYETYYNL